MMKDLEGLSFLVVDDHKYMRELTVRILRQLGCRRVDMAADGQEAMDLLTSRTVEVDAIVLDLDMPTINGLQFLKWLRSGADCVADSNLPVFVLSGRTELDIVAKTSEFAISGYLAKPLVPAQLLARISKVFAKSASSQGGD